MRGFCVLFSPFFFLFFFFLVIIESLIFDIEHTISHDVKSQSDDQRIQAWEGDPEMTPYRKTVADYFRCRE